MRVAAPWVTLLLAALHLVVPDSHEDDGTEGAELNRPDGALASGDALLRLGAAAVAIPSGPLVGVVTKAGRWIASLASPGPATARGLTAWPARGLAAWTARYRARGARSLPALHPGLLLGWSWPDLLQHAVAVAAAADPSWCCADPRGLRAPGRPRARTAGERRRTAEMLS